MVTIWLPSWLGARYLRLLETFQYRVFSLNDVRRVLGGDKNIRVIVSELCKRGWVLRLSRGYYTVLSPYALLVRGGWEREVKQRTYLPLILAVATRLFEWLNSDLVSIAIFGSVARGEAKPNSDLDVLVVSEYFPSSYLKRVKIAVDILDPLRHLKLWLWHNKKIFCNIELVMLTREEAVATHPIYLDMLHRSIIVYDKDSFLGGILERLAERLGKIGAERVILPNGRWFWRLKPEAKMGEVIEI